MRGEWTQLHGYYLTKAVADRHAKSRRQAASRGFAPEDRPSYRVRSQLVRGRSALTIDYDPRGVPVHVQPGQRFYWIEEKRP